MNFSLADFKAKLQAVLAAIIASIPAQIATAVSNLKGGVAASYDTLEKLRAYFQGEVDSLVSDVATKASTTYVDTELAAKQSAIDGLGTSKADKTYVDGQVATINGTLANKANSSDVTTEINASKTSLINGASTYQDFAAVEAALANQSQLITAIQTVGAAGGAVVDIAATVTLPAAPGAAGRQVYVFNQTPTGPESGELTSATIAGFAAMSPYMSGNILTLTDGDELHVTYDDGGSITGVQFHNDDTKAKAEAAVTARVEDFNVAQTAGKIPDSASLDAHLKANYVQGSDLDEVITMLDTVLATIPNS